MCAKPRAKKSGKQAAKKQRRKQRPIRIVPMHPGAAAAAAPGAVKLTYRGGPLLTAVEVFTVFWGAAWQQAANSEVMTRMNQFFDYILGSPLVAQLSEYSVPGQSIGNGTRSGTTVILSPAPGATVQDAEIQNLIQQGIASGRLPANHANTLYFVFLPDGVTVEDQGSASCQTFCGYHDSFGSHVYYAVMPYPGCSGCTGGLAVFDALTATSSHELCEAITDPVPGEGWYDDNNGEIGDICAWKTKQLGGYTVQLEWSNQAQACE